MEDTLGELVRSLLKSTSKSLNPCFNGRYSRSSGEMTLTDKVIVVLILVLIEDTLGVLVK